MKFLVAPISALFLSGLTWADCGSADSAGSDNVPHASREVLRRAGYEQFRNGQFQKAMACYIAALHRIETQDSRNARTLASDLNDLGIVSEEMGHYGDARKYYERELELLKPLGETIGGEGLGTVYERLANLSLVEGSLSASEADYKQAVALLTRHAGPDDLRTAEAWGGMGRHYAEWGRYEESEKLLRQARTIAEKSAPTSDWVLIDILDSEATLLCQARKFAAAEKSWLRALKIAENDYGADGLQYSALLLHLGQLYTGIRDYPAAQAMLERGLAIEQKAKGEDSMDRAIATSALGNVYLLQHKLARAEPLFLKSLYALDGNCGTIPLACATVRSFLGDFYMAKGQWQSAEGEYEIALTLRKSALEAITRW